MASQFNGFTSLKNKVESKEAKVGVVGLGYVGLPIAVSLASAGFEVTGIDIDDDKISDIHSGRSYVEDVEKGRCTASTGNT